MGQPKFEKDPFQGEREALYVPVDIYIEGGITEYSESSISATGSLNLGPLNFNTSLKEIDLAMDLRLVDTTGFVVRASTVPDLLG